MDCITQRARALVTSSAPSLTHWTGTGLIKRNKLASQMAQRRHRTYELLTLSTLLEILTQLVKIRYLFRPSYWKIGRVYLTSSDHTGLQPMVWLSKPCLHDLPGFGVVQALYIFTRIQFSKSFI